MVGENDLGVPFSETQLLIQAFCHNFSNVLDSQVALRGCCRIAKHNHAEWAADCQRALAAFFRFVEAILAHAFCAVLLFFPHLRAARAAAE